MGYRRICRETQGNLDIFGSRVRNLEIIGNLEMTWRLLSKSGVSRPNQEIWQLCDIRKNVTNRVNQMLFFCKELTEGEKMMGQPISYQSWFNSYGDLQHLPKF